jgi:polyhydroxybutyrate depolymerase
LVAGIALIACSPRSQPASTDIAASEVTIGEIEHDGRQRTYRLFVPADIGSGYPLVVALHGGLGSGEQFASASGYDEVAAREGFAVIYPDGYRRTWNGGGCCGRAVAEDVDDVGFLVSLIEQLTQELPIDPERVFMTGHSNGAIMTFRVACERSDLVAAVAPVAGSLEVADCAPPRGIPLLLIHGDSDRNHPLEGGEGERSLAGVAFTSVEESMATWTAALGCASPQEPIVEGAVMTTTWTTCRDGAIAQTVIIAGADHPWPGGTVQAEAIQGTPTQELDATEATWSFFVTSSDG